MDTRSWHYRIWQWCALALRPRSFKLPTRVNALDYWLTVIFSPLIALFWLGGVVLLAVFMAAIYTLITVVNLAVIPFGLTLSYRTAKFEPYRPLFKIYRQRVYPIHLICALGVLAAFVGMIYLFVNPPEERRDPLVLWIMMDLMFNAILLLLTAGLMSTQRIGKRLDAYARYWYRHLPRYTFDHDSKIGTTN